MIYQFLHWKKGTVEQGIVALNAIWLTDNPLLNMESMMALVKKARAQGHMAVQR